MPREAAVQSMLEYTVQFESLLYEFLGKDYGGVCPDRAPYPRGASLIEDGHFIPFRLAGSTLYQEAKMKLSEIDAVASNVFAATPGKNSFDWIRQAVEWIDSLNQSFSRSASGKFTLELEEANNLLTSAEAVFLDVSDDLKQTLGQHGILISANKEGKLTVKSKKKGAQYATGTTIIRWCPILFDALKSDWSRCQRWSEKFRSLAQDYKTFQDTYGGDVTEESVMKCHVFLQVGLVAGKDIPLLYCFSIVFSHPRVDCPISGDVRYAARSGMPCCCSPRFNGIIYKHLCELPGKLSKSALVA